MLPERCGIVFAIRMRTHEQDDLGPRGFFFAILIGVMFGLISASLLASFTYGYLHLSRATLTRTIEALDAENGRLHAQLSECRQATRKPL